MRSLQQLHCGQQRGCVLPEKDKAFLRELVKLVQLDPDVRDCMQAIGEEEVHRLMQQAVHRAAAAFGPGPAVSVAAAAGLMPPGDALTAHDIA